jgi:hypothetical protein
MKSSRCRSLFFASLVGLVSGTFWFSGCRPTSEQGTGRGGSGGAAGSGGGGSGGDEGGEGGSSEGGEGGTSQGGDEGGESGSGGISDTGGASETGGTTSSGGNTSSGGTTTGGGASGSGGNAGGGSAPSNGGAGGGGSAPSGNTVTIANGKGSGAMVGYGWVALGSEDEVSDPTCGGTPIISTSSCESTTWATKDALCVSGKIPALPTEPKDTDYTNNWGISVGLNASETAGKGIGQTFSTVAITVTGSPTSGLRALVHKGGDADADSYCLAYATGPLQLSKFAQDCWAEAPVKLLAASDIPNLDKVSVQVTSTSSPITVDKLCITGITFGN